MVHVLGISGSPRKGATYKLVKAAVEGAESMGDCTTEFVTLSELSINPCRDHCVECIAQNACVQDDDMRDLYPKILASDGIILGSPVYFGSPSALCKAFMERMQGFGNKEKKLRLKVGGSIAVGAGRNAGQETAMIAMNLWYHINDMLPVGITAPASQWGVAGQSGPDPDDIDNDILQLRRVDHRISSKEMSWMYGRKIARVAQIVQAGIRTLDVDLPDPYPYGWGLPIDFPASVRHKDWGPEVNQDNSGS